MAEIFDFKKEWPRIKKELQKLSNEAKIMAKKGEDEIVRYSHIGKLHIDAKTLGLKKEHLYIQIGKEYVKAGCPATQTPKLKKLIKELGAIDKQVSTLRRKIKSTAAKKKPGTTKRKPKALPTKN